MGTILSNIRPCPCAYAYHLRPVLHFVEAVRFRMRWLLPTVGLAGLIEGFGWGCRLWSAYHPLAETPYQIQYTFAIFFQDIATDCHLEITPSYWGLLLSWRALLFSLQSLRGLLVSNIVGYLPDGVSSGVRALVLLLFMIS